MKPLGNLSLISVSKPPFEKAVLNDPKVAGARDVSTS